RGAEGGQGDRHVSARLSRARPNPGRAGVTAAAAPAFRAALAALELIDSPVLLRQKSRDFYWYSPILKRELDGKAADLIVVPRAIDEGVQVAAARARPRVPVRGRA